MEKMITLAGYRKILDLITDWAESNGKDIYASFEADSSGILLELSSGNYDTPIDLEAVKQIEELFLSGVEMVNSYNDMCVYMLGEAVYKFDVSTIELLNYATERGFVLNGGALKHTDSDTILDFIRANPEFILKVNEEGEVIVF